MERTDYRRVQRAASAHVATRLPISDAASENALSIKCSPAHCSAYAWHFFDCRLDSAERLVAGDVPMQLHTTAALALAFSSGSNGG